MSGVDRDAAIGLASPLMTQAVPDLLTAREAARLCGVSVRTLHRYVKGGKLTGYRTPGGTFRYRRADILALNTPVTGS